MRRLLALGLCALALGCQPQGSTKTGTPVARGNGVVVTAEEFKARLDEQSPFIRARYTTLERKKEFLDNLIRQEILAVEAERMGLDKDPDVRATLRKIMVQKLVQKRFQADATPPEVPEADVAKYYEDHKAEYVRPRRVRVHAIVLAAAPGTPDRAKKLALARKTLATVKAEDRKNPMAFAQEVARISEDLPSKQLAGDLQFRSHDELAASYSKAVADAAFALRPGAYSNVVETPTGFFILRFTGEQPELNRTLDQVKPQIAARLSRDKKTKEFDEWMKSLRENAKVTVDEAALERIEVSLPQQPMPAMGMPGLQVQPIPSPHK